VEGDQNISLVFDTGHDVVGRINIHMGPRRNNIHFHAPDFRRGIVIFINDAESCDGGPTLGGINENRKATFGMNRGVNHPDTVDNLHITRHHGDLPIVFHIFDIIFQIAVVQGMGGMNRIQLGLVDKKPCILTFIIIFTMVHVQMGVDDDIDVLGGKTMTGKALFKGINFSLDGGFPVRGLDGIHLACVHQDILVSTLDDPGKDRNGKGLSLTMLVCHHAFVKDFGPHDHWMDGVTAHIADILSHLKFTQSPFLYRKCQENCQWNPCLFAFIHPGTHRQISHPKRPHSPLLPPLPGHHTGPHPPWTPMTFHHTGKQTQSGEF